MNTKLYNTKDISKFDYIFRITQFEKIKVQKWCEDKLTFHVV